MTAPIVDERVSAIIACAGGGPRASGRGPLAFKATLATAQAIIEGTESVFVRHGEKVLRSNCGGILAKDETYGFAFVDLMYGLLAPRGPDKGCAIPLGEKLRKLNKKRADEYSAKRRAAGKLAAEERQASGGLGDRRGLAPAEAQRGVHRRAGTVCPHPRPLCCRPARGGQARGRPRPRPNACTDARDRRAAGAAAAAAAQASARREAGSVAGCGRSVGRIEGATGARDAEAGSAWPPQAPPPPAH